MIATDAKTKNLTGTHLLIDSLITAKTKIVFGSTGGVHQSIFDPFDDYPNMKKMILEHEQATIHAADGYARATGKIGVAYLPSNSAITNAITGILTAQMDSAPLVIIIVHDDQKNSDNGVDIFGMTTPITKYYMRINHISEIQTSILKAVQIAGGGRPGNVVIEIAKSVLEQQTMSYQQQFPLSSHINEKVLSDKMLEHIKQEISIAKKPVLIVGGGVISSGSSELVRKLVHTTKIPVASTLMGLGAFPANHPLFLGMLGMHGTFAANKAVHRSDLLICLGIRFSDRVTGKISGFSPKSRKIQIDIDAAEINKNIPVDLPIVGNVHTVLSQLIDHIEPGDTEEWVRETSTWQRVAPRFADSKSELKPQQVIQLLDRYSSEDAKVATDVGQHQIWTALNYQFNTPRTFITSGGLGTMGFGLPAAIGAAVGSNGEDVICISGDGSFQMNFQELAAIAAYQLPVKIAILKNGYLGMVRQWQELFYKGRYSSVKISSPNFVTLASAYGLPAYSADNLIDAEAIIQQAFSHNGPAVMEFDITEEENVFPMVPPGSSNADTILK